MMAAIALLAGCNNRWFCSAPEPAPTGELENQYSWYMSINRSIHDVPLGKNVYVRKVTWSASDGAIWNDPFHSTPESSPYVTAEYPTRAEAIKAYLKKMDESDSQLPPLQSVTR